MAAPVLTSGTVEYLPVKVTDALKRISSLDSTDLHFDIYKADIAETPVETNVSGDNQGMLALCLVDTTSLDEGEYDLFIHFQALPETPRLGPFRFRVD
jgi:hypothetical protein